MTFSKKTWRQQRIERKALELAFADLDVHDQKMYLTEAEKAINKSDRKLYGSELDLILADEEKNKKCPACNRIPFIPRACPKCNEYT